MKDIRRVWTSTGSAPSYWEVKLNNQGIGTNYNQAYTYYSDGSQNGVTITAYLNKVYHPTFQNDFGAGLITLDGTSYSSGSSVPKSDGNSVLATASAQTYNGLDYTFSHWQDNNTSNPRSFAIGGNTTYTAYYTATPNASYSSQNLHVGTTLNDNIHIYWTDNQNSIVDHYYIYRKIGYRGTPSLIASVGRGVQQCIDGCYYLQQYPNGTEVLYEVLEYSSYYNSYSCDNSWADVYGYFSLEKEKSNNVSIGIAKEIPTEYKIGNYPNPFNPTTSISYQLPKDGYVTLKVYDILGKEIATLVNENKTAGYYKVNFDASRLTSGVYIYKISSNNFSLSKKMLLTK